MLRLELELLAGCKGFLFLSPSSLKRCFLDGRTSSSELTTSIGNSLLIKEGRLNGLNIAHRLEGLSLRKLEIRVEDAIKTRVAMDFEGDVTERPSWRERLVAYLTMNKEHLVRFAFILYQHDSL